METVETVETVETGGSGRRSKEGLWEAKESLEVRYREEKRRSRGVEEWIRSDEAKC